MAFVYALMSADGQTVEEYRSFAEAQTVGQGALGDFANMILATVDQLTTLAPPVNPLDAGLQIISTSAPALNGTYGIATSDQANISGVAAGIASRNRVPGGGATFNYGDIDGKDHTFTGPQFLDLAAAMEDFVYALAQGNSPTQPVTIA